MRTVCDIIKEKEVELQEKLKKSYLEYNELREIKFTIRKLSNQLKKIDGTIEENQGVLFE